MNGSRRWIDALWIATLAATGIAWRVGESGLGATAGWPVAIVFALSLAKGLAIALEFMELRGAPAVWRRFVVGWLLVVILTIAAARLWSG